MEKKLKKIIEEHYTEHQRTVGLYNRYKGDVDIKRRTLKGAEKINRKLANDYRGDIINTVTGYIWGNPITYLVDKEKYADFEYEKITDILYDFNTRNAIDDLDAETGKIASICGYACRLLYIDFEGFENVINVMPWQCIFNDDWAIRYYKVDRDEGGKTVERTKVELYNNNEITFYIEDSEGNYGLDITEEKNPVKHMFLEIPLIKIVNNDEEQGDFEKVEELIDAYDLALSDAQNEIEEFRQAYMVFMGCEPDEETIIAARESGGFGVGEGQDIKFLTKQINDVFLENHKQSLNENIYKFSKTVDMSDESFSGGQQSGESRKWKLLGLENKSIIKERKFSKGLRQMFKVLCTSWNTKSIPVNYLDIYYEFKRNIPVEMNMEADILQKLKGVISDKTRLGLVSFVDDPDWEIEQMKAEAEDYGKGLLDLEEGDDEDGNRDSVPD